MAIDLEEFKKRLKELEEKVQLLIRDYAKMDDYLPDVFREIERDKEKLLKKIEVNTSEISWLWRKIYWLEDDIEEIKEKLGMGDEE